MMKVYFFKKIGNSLFGWRKKRMEIKYFNKISKYKKLKFIICFLNLQIKEHRYNQHNLKSFL